MTDAAEPNFDDLDGLPEVDLGENDGAADPLYCMECDRTFKNDHGKAIHDARIHGLKKAPGDSAPASRKSAGTTDLEKQLQEFFTTIGLVVSMADQYDGFIIAQNSGRLASSWAHLAKSNKTVDKALRSLMTASTTAEVVTSTLAVAIPIMAHHGMLPDQVAGMFVPPSDEANEPSSD